MVENPQRVKAKYSEGRYKGETLLHVLAVNRRYSLLRLCMHLVHKHFSELDQRRWLMTMCEGSFFAEEPQRDYGGHILAYMCCFGELELVQECVEEMGFREWPIWHCKLTGWLPVHAAVRAGRRDMFDFLVETFGIEMLTKQVHGFTPLILAARAGQAKMVRHILKRHMVMRWSWGDLTRFTFNVIGCIDSDPSERKHALSSEPKHPSLSEHLS